MDRIFDPIFKSFFIVQASTPILQFKRRKCLHQQNNVVLFSIFHGFDGIHWCLLHKFVWCNRQYFLIGANSSDNGGVKALMGLS